MKNIAFALSGSAILLVLVFGLMAKRPHGSLPTRENSDAITLYCAASNRMVVESIVAQYRLDTGRKIHTQYGASQTLLTNLKVSQTGDLYLPADSAYIQLAQDKDLLATVLKVGHMQIGVAVKLGNPKRIAVLDDLLRQDVRLVQANPETAAAGHITRQCLEKSGKWKSLKQATVTFRNSVTAGANDILIGAADAAIVYDAILHTYPGLEFVELDALQAAVSHIEIGVIASSKQPAAALHFARYLTAQDRGLMHYREHGFSTIQGDNWIEQ